MMKLGDLVGERILDNKSEIDVTLSVQYNFDYMETVTEIIIALLTENAATTLSPVSREYSTRAIWRLTDALEFIRKARVA